MWKADISNTWAKPWHPDRNTCAMLWSRNTVFGKHTKYLRQSFQKLGWGWLTRPGWQENEEERWRTQIFAEVKFLEGERKVETVTKREWEWEWWKVKEIWEKWRKWPNTVRWEWRRQVNEKRREERGARGDKWFLALGLFHLSEKFHFKESF